MTVGHGGLTSGSIRYAAGLERVVRFDPGDSSGRAALPVRDERGLEPALAWLAGFFLVGLVVTVSLLLALMWAMLRSRRA